MRFIDIERLMELIDWPPGKHPQQKYTPQKWRELVRQAEEELRNLPPGKTRGDIFKDYSDLWSDVKEHFRAISRNKCWYCETSLQSIPGDIDHHRPKGRVAEAGKEHEGYWWLGFEWRNWRLACRYCNSRFRDPETGELGGKGTHFPLVGNDETRRVRQPADYEDYEDLWQENPLLLDPTELGDTTLLTFTGLGEGKPEPAEKNPDSVDHQRASASITLYHLDRSTLNRERKKIYVKVLEYVRDYQRYQRKWEKDGDQSARVIARKAMKELGRMIAQDAPYSMAAIAYLNELYQDHHSKNHRDWEWIYTLLTRPSQWVYDYIPIPVTVRSEIDSSVDQ